MHQRLKKLADDAIAVQNKDAMESALKEISQLCDGRSEQVETKIVPDAKAVATKIKGGK